MSNSSSKTGRWIAAVLALGGLIAIFYNLVHDNTPKGESRKISGYVPWSQETIEAAETIPVQNGGRIKPLSTYAGFTMLGLHGARSMAIELDDGKVIKIQPTEWMLDALFRPHFAIQQPTFRVDNSAALKAAGVEPRGMRDRYSYAELEIGRAKLVELAQTYEAIDSKKRDPIQTQTVDLAHNFRNYESLLGYFGFARTGITLYGTGDTNTPDQRTDFSTVLLTAPQIREQLSLSKANSTEIPTHVKALLEQVLDGANYSKFGLFMIPPADPTEKLWKSAGSSIMEVMTSPTLDPTVTIADVNAMENTARAVTNEPEFRNQLIALRDSLAKRAEARGEYQFIALEAQYYHINWFLYALVFFLIGTITALAMWTLGQGKISNILAWATFITTLTGLIYCLVAITKRCIIMQRPPIGNLYDTVIFIGATVVMLALIVEWLSKKRFALGIAPILGALFIVLARRYELGDAKDHMDPLVAVLDSNFWLTTHVITMTLGYSAGFLSAYLSCGYLLLRGLRLDGGNKDLRRSLTKAVYGMVCLTLFLSLVGTVLGGIWANYSWGRFWGWDPKENGALLIVIWTLSILHARLGGFIKEWGLHLASVFTAIIITFSWWHVNFLGVGLHNYGFTAGKDTIWVFYGVMLAFLIFGFVVMFIEKIAVADKASQRAAAKLEPAKI